MTFILQNPFVLLLHLDASGFNGGCWFVTQNTCLLLCFSKAPLFTYTVQTNDALEEETFHSIQTKPLLQDTSRFGHLVTMKHHLFIFFYRGPCVLILKGKMAAVGLGRQPGTP